MSQKLGLQGLLPFYVEMVGRFVEQIEVGLRQPQKQHGKTGLLPSRQVATGCS
jgi:hypothetical protein